GGLRFNDHIAESVRGARKNEDVGGGVGGREFSTSQISGEESFRERFGKLARIGAVADNTKLDRQSLVAQAPIRFRQKIEILLTRNATHIEQSDLSVFSAELLEEHRIAPGRMEQLRVEPAGENFQLGR